MLLLLLFRPAARAADGAVAEPSGHPPRSYAAVRLQGPPPVIDGQLDDACWQSQGEWSGGFTQLTPRYAAAPSRPTEIKILFDDHNVYVAMRAYDDPPALRSRQAGPRDSFTGDIMGVNFDSHHDRRTGYEFDLTASGQKIDLVLLNSSWDTSWNAVWEGKVAHAPDCWTAEFLIPLSQLRYDPDNHVWGLHAWRWIDRLKEESDWNLLANDDSGTVKSFGELHGLEGLRAARRIEVLPYVSGRVDTGGGEAARTRLRAGVDAKLGVTGSITLDASVRPDFGQVEADPAVMNLTVFETFLTEKRALFLEGKEIFDFPFKDDTLFYSRRIGQPPTYVPDGQVGATPETTTLLAAVKLAGRTSGGLSLGVLGSATAREEVTVVDANGAHAVAVAPQSAQMIVRLQQELRGGDTLVGGLVTREQRDLPSEAMRAWLPQEATVAGADLWHYWADREYFVHAVAVGSVVSGSAGAISRLQLSPARYYQRPVDGSSRYDPDLDRMPGTGFWLKAGRGSKGHWRWSEEVLEKSPGLEFNDLGYLAEADRRQQASSITYVEKDPAAWYRSYSLEFDQSNTWTTRNEFLGSGLTSIGAFEFSNKWTLATVLGVAGEGRDPVALRGGPLLRVPASGNWNLQLDTDGAARLWGRLYVKGYQSRYSAFASQSVGGLVSVRVSPALALTANLDLAREQDRAHFVPLTLLNGAADGYFVSRQTGVSRSLEFRADWILRPELSLQYYGNPFGSSVRNDEFRRVRAPGASEYAARFGPVLHPGLSGGSYAFDENRDGVVDYTLADPDGNYASFHSNLVLKWEYRRGSTLYLIWAQERDGADADKTLNAWSMLGGLRRRLPVNQFMVKMTYWFSS